MDKPERLHNVLKHDRLPFDLFVLAEALSIYQLHLLEDGRFSRFTGAYGIEKHNLVSRVLPIWTRSPVASNVNIARRHTQQQQFDLLLQALLVGADGLVELPAAGSPRLIVDVAAAEAHLARGQLADCSRQVVR